MLIIFASVSPLRLKYVQICCSEKKDNFDMSDSMLQFEINWNFHTMSKSRATVISSLL